MGLPTKLAIAAVAAGALPCAVAAMPAAAAFNETASVEWEFSPPNGSGVTCSLRAEGRVSLEEDGRMAFGRLTVLDDDPECRPALASVKISYWDQNGTRQVSEASAKDSSGVSVAGFNATDPAEAVVQVSAHYEGCDDFADCTTFKELRPK